jgi:hypothetical protein
MGAKRTLAETYAKVGFGPVTTKFASMHTPT